MSTVIQTPSLGEEPHRVGDHGSPHWSLSVLHSSYGEYTPRHPLSPSSFSFTPLPLGSYVPPKGCSPFLAQQAAYTRCFVGVWALGLDCSSSCSSFRDLQTVSYMYLQVWVLLGLQPINQSAWAQAASVSSCRPFHLPVCRKCSLESA